MKDCTEGVGGFFRLLNEKGMKNLVCERDKRGFYNPQGSSVSPQVQAQKHLTSVQTTVVNPSWAFTIR